MKKLFALMTILLLAVFATAAQDDPVEIEFVHIFGGDEDSRGLVILEIAEAFMAQNPGVVVRVTSPSTSYVDLFNSVLLAAEQGNAPQVVQVEEGLTQLAADSGFFIPVSDLASEDQLATLDDIMPTIRSFYTIGEEVWSIPWNSSNPILYYNRGMFEEAGLDPEQAPATFQDILDACEAIVAADIELTSCANWPMATWFPEQWITMQDALIFDNDNGRTARATEALFTSDELVGVIEWWAEMAANGYYSYSGAAGDYNGEGIAFLSRQTAITINSTAGITLFQQFSALQGIDLGIARLPVPDESATNGVTVGGASVWLTAGHSEAEAQAAIDFMFFLTNTENDMLWHQNSGYFPNRLSSIDQLTAEGWWDEAPVFRIALDQLLESNDNFSNAGGVIGPSVEVRNALVQAIQSIVDGGQPVEAALEAAKARADGVIADYNELVGG